MKLFRSKLQYKNYEPGEFSDEKERSTDEIFLLIRDFPWAEQCHLVAIGLTAPSVTIEREDGSFLKISHSYYGKFSIYWLQSSGPCLKKVVPYLGDAIKEVSEFCSDTLSENSFEQEHGFHLQRHFYTKDFTNHVSKGALFPIVIYSIFPFLMMVPLGIIAFNWQTLSISGNKFSILLLIAYIGATTVTIYLGIMAWRLFHNHYSYSLGQFIEISRGKDEFTFGTDNEYQVYLKSQIKLVKAYSNTQSRNPWGHIKHYEINFLDGTQLNISSLLLKNAILGDAPIEWVSKFYPRIG